MQIVDIETHRLERSLWGDFWAVQQDAEAANPMGDFPREGPSWSWWTWPQAVVLVRVTCDDSTTGLGVAEDGSGAATQIIRNHLGRLVVGQNAWATERIWDQLFRASIPYGRKGAALEAISAIDIAIWDALGKGVGQPVYELLGGWHGRGVSAYASKIHPDEDRDEVARVAADFVARGYRGVKINFPHSSSEGRRGLERNLDFAGFVREAIGPEVELMSDAYMGFDRHFATQMAKGLERHGIRWLEEPLVPDDVAGHAELRALRHVPIATGEHEFSRYGFARLIEAKAADVLQPDVHRVGGITEARRVCQLAAAHHLEVAPHVFSAATAHIVLSQPACRWIEHLTVPSYLDESSRVTPLLLGDPEVVDGDLVPSDEPGIGVRLNPEVAVGPLEEWVD